jgi:hypothetical protein
VHGCTAGSPRATGALAQPTAATFDAISFDRCGGIALDPFDLSRRGRATIRVVTAKEQLLQRVRELSEAEAAETLRLLDTHQDPLNRRLDDAPLEDEEISSEEEAAVQEARDELSAGAELISHEEIKREFGIT